MSDMETMMQLRDTITPKSDQLNADDMITGPITVTITGVRRGSKDQPVIIDIDGGYQPYKPCKSMRRVMIAAWGDNGNDWVGRSMTLYCDPAVKFGGVALGGVRISHMSHLSTSIAMMLTTTRGRRSEYVVEPLVAHVSSYPDALFNERKQAMIDAINEGKITVNDVIARCKKDGGLTESQIEFLRSSVETVD